jgi:hypothetical protein
MALTRVWIPSPSYSSRGGSGVRLIVLHTAEGARTIEDLGHFFQNGANQVSSHTGADNQKNKVGEYVSRGNKSWTCAAFNPVAVQIELCAFASWSRETWMNQNHEMLVNCGKWIAEEAKHFGIPITKLSPSQAQGSGRGVCQHRDLGAGGSGHTDCGDGFPIDYVLDLARGGAAPPKPVIHYDPEEETMQLSFDAGAPNEAPKCAIAIGNQYSSGKHKLRFSAGNETALRIDFGSGVNKITVSYLEPLSVNIPEGKREAVVKRDSGTGPVSVAISER